MELNKNIISSAASSGLRSGSAARLLDTPSDVSENENEMMAHLSESDEHLTTAISLRIDHLNDGVSEVSGISEDPRISTPMNDLSPNVWPKIKNGSSHLAPPGMAKGLTRPATDPIITAPKRVPSALRLSQQIIPMIRDTTLKIKPEIILAFLLAGIGNVAAGYMLAKVQLWNVFRTIPQLLILVQPLLGLKGNVEMTLASRLSTHSNLGDLDNAKDRNLILFGNMALIQCQASVVGFIAPIVAILLSFSSDYERESLDHKEMILIIASSVITANLANLILGTIMCTTIIVCRKYGVNPDNIATPIAASLGDVTTLCLLAYISHGLFGVISPDAVDATLGAVANNTSNHPEVGNLLIKPSFDATPGPELLQNVLLIALMSLIPLWSYFARTNHYTKNVIVTGWFPVCGAMLLQNAGGLIMERACENFERLAKFQPIINGVGGNLVAIQASRMSTHLHKNCVPNRLPASDSDPCSYPGHTFFSNESAHTKMARLLLLLAGPAHIVFLLITKTISPDFFMTPSFIFCYIFVSILQVGVLLQACDNFVHWLWSLGVDPDNVAIPFLTAIADLIGSVFLALVFVFLFQIGDPNAMNSVSSESSGVQVFDVQGQDLIGIINGTRVL